MTPTCQGCGVDLYDETDIACTICDLCKLCWPAAGRCFDCRDMRQEDLAERATRYAIENEAPC